MLLCSHQRSNLHAFPAWWIAKTQLQKLRSPRNVTALCLDHKSTGNNGQTWHDASLWDHYYIFCPNFPIPIYLGAISSPKYICYRANVISSYEFQLTKVLVSLSGFTNLCFPPLSFRGSALVCMDISDPLQTRQNCPQINIYPASVMSGVSLNIACPCAFLETVHAGPVTHL